MIPGADTVLLYLLHCILFLFAWGYGIARVIGFRGFAFALAVPLSLLLLLANAMVARAFGIPIGWLHVALYAQVALCLALWMGRLAREGALSPGWRHRQVSLFKEYGDHWIQWFTVPGLMVTLGAYLWMAGPYTEVPADFWTHAASMQSEYRSLSEAGVLAPSDTWSAYLGKDGGWWYAMQALLIHVSGITVMESFGPQAFVNSLILLAVYFWFVTRVLRWSDIDERAIHPVAAIAVVFFLMHYGTNVFSFVRYYTFGPTFLNHVMLFVFLAMALSTLEGRVRSKPAHYSVAGLLLVAMAVIHLQEALFAVILCYGMLLVLWVQRAFPRFAGSESQALPGEWFTARRLGLLVVGVTVILLAGGVQAHLNLARHDPLDYGRLVDVERLLPFLRNLFILDPTRQFYETVTLWGYLVIALFVLKFERFRANPLLVAGMLSPLFTVFNPLFIDWFLRLSVPWILWRFLFLLPLAIVAAILFYDAVRGMWSNPGLLWRAGGGLVVLGLLVLLFPIESRFIHSPYSKVQTLKPVASGNDYRHWSDLFEFLNELEERRHIMTDPVTGYMVRALTLHRELGHKFDTSLSPGYRALIQIQSDDAVYRRYRGSLIVLNLRSGGHSRTGQISRHWRDHQLDLIRYYPVELVAFVNGDPSRFHKRWESGEIQIFEIV